MLVSIYIEHMHVPLYVDPCHVRSLISMHVSMSNDIQQNVRVCVEYVLGCLL